MPNVHLPEAHSGLDIFIAFRQAVLAEKTPDRQVWNLQPDNLREGLSRGCRAYVRTWRPPNRIANRLFGAGGKWESKDIWISLKPLNFRELCSEPKIEVSYPVSFSMSPSVEFRLEYGHNLDDPHFAPYRSAYDNIVERFLETLDELTEERLNTV